MSNNQLAQQKLITLNRILNSFHKTQSICDLLRGNINRERAISCSRIGCENCLFYRASDAKQTINETLIINQIITNKE